MVDMPLAGWRSHFGQLIARHAVAACVSLQLWCVQTQLITLLRSVNQQDCEDGNDSADIVVEALRLSFQSIVLLKNLMHAIVHIL